MLKLNYSEAFVCDVIEINVKGQKIDYGGSRRDLFGFVVKDSNRLHGFWTSRRREVICRSIAQLRNVFKVLKRKVWIESSNVFTAFLFISFKTFSLGEIISNIYIHIVIT